MAANLNTKNPAVKRILQEIKEMQVSSDCTNFVAEPMAEDIFTWQFVIRGPVDTEFANGLYHGRILLPPEYPFKPPSFVMLTPSGRFETNVKICLSISSHHPEHWQPSWSIRTALMALIGFLPTAGKGAVGSMDLPAADRKILAQQSRKAIPYVSSSARREVMQQLHDRMLAFEARSAATSAAPEPELADAAPAAELAETAPEDDAAPAPQPAPEPAAPACLSSKERCPMKVEAATTALQPTSTAPSHEHLLRLLDRLIIGVVLMIAGVVIMKVVSYSR